MSWPEWEGIAASHLDAAGIGSPVDPWLIAWSLDLEVRTGPPGWSCFDKAAGIIYVDPDDRVERQGFTVAHECAHLLLDEHGARNTEAAANGLASCLMLPHADFGRDSRRLGGDLFALRDLHSWASHEAIARRLVSMSPSVAWVWDVEGPRRGRYSLVTPGLKWAHRRPTRVELDALEGALKSKEPVEAIGGVRAWPVLEPGFVRVISVSAMDALMPM